MSTKTLILNTRVTHVHVYDFEGTVVDVYEHKGPPCVYAGLNLNPVCPGDTMWGSESWVFADGRCCKECCMCQVGPMVTHGNPQELMCTMASTPCGPWPPTAIPNTQWHHKYNAIMQRPHERPTLGSHPWVCKTGFAGKSFCEVLVNKINFA